MIKVIETSDFKIVVEIIEEMGGKSASLTSVGLCKEADVVDPDVTLHDAAMEAIESLVLSHALSGIDIEKSEYADGVAFSVNSFDNYFSLEEE